MTTCHSGKMSKLAIKRISQVLRKNKKKNNRNLFVFIQKMNTSGCYRLYVYQILTLFWTKIKTIKTYTYNFYFTIDKPHSAQFQFPVLELSIFSRGNY